MTTLTQPGLSSLIDRLFAEADAAEDARWPATAGDRADYRQYYGELKDQPLPVSRATGEPICWCGPPLALSFACLTLPRSPDELLCNRQIRERACLSVNC